MTADGGEVVPFDPVGDAIDGADEILPPVDDGDGGGGEAQDGDGDGGKRRKGRGPGIPDEVPVIPVGKQGNFYYVIDSTGQLRAIKDTELGRAKIYSLFDRCLPMLYKHWPRTKEIEGAGGAKQLRVTGIQFEKVQEAILHDCASAEKGIWDPLKFLRGPGCWKGDDGELVVHCGLKIWRGAAPSAGNAGGFSTELRPGRLGRHVYPAAPMVPMPAERPEPSGDAGPAGRLLKTLGMWNWRRPGVDPYLLLGWIGAAMLAGALKWRPMVWVTGDRGTGKSTLHDLMRLVFDDSILSVTDTSAAGLWQKIGHSALPVAVDELEADADARQAQGIIKLARHAASGGTTLRGGADHTATEFQARNCFMFSSILVPPLKSQDRSRQAILQLDDLVEGAMPPGLEALYWRKIGCGLLGRLCDGWYRWEPTLEAYRASLRANGHDGRGSDQWGTLLAAADLLLHDHLPDSDTLDDWAGKLRVKGVTGGRRDGADHEDCLRFLMTTTAESFRGGLKRPIGSYIAEAAGIEGSDGTMVNPDEANRVLMTLGLKVHTDKANVQWLAVAGNHQGLQAIYQGTHWAGHSGAEGAFHQAMERVDGAEFAPSNLRFAGVPSRCLLIPLAPVLHDME